MEHPGRTSPPGGAVRPARHTAQEAPARRPEAPQDGPHGLPHPGPAPAAAPHVHRWTRWRAALHARREHIRSDPRTNHLWRVAVAVAGSAVTALGLVLVPLPGPGWLIVLIGLAVLGSEFHWARRTHLFARRHVHAWTAWVAARSWTVRLLLGAATACLVAATAWGWLAWQGVPGWVPLLVATELRRLPGVG
ncbi:TIGR02611 family protein [Kineococcus sp. NUM-3379]